MMVTSSKPETQSRGVDLRRAGRPGPALLRRRGSGSASPVLAVGSLRMDTAARRVHRGEGEIALTAKEGAGLTVLLVLRANLTDRADLEAEVAAREVAGQLALDKPFDELDLGDEETHPVQVTPAPAPTSEGGDGDDDGDDDDSRDDPGRGEVSSDEPGFTDGTATVDGETADYRFATVEATTSAGLTLTVHAGAPLAAEQEAVSTVRGAMLTGLPVLLLVVSGVTWLVTRRALRPVEGIRRELAAITASEDLARRVPEPGSRDEIARLARTTNETLSVLEASVGRQRRFVADASHELRSPIASLRTQLEVGAAHPELLDVPGAVADTVELQDLAADLLLARLDAGERPGRAAVDLGALVREEVSQRTGDRVPVAVSVRDEGALEVRGSRGQLARVVGNLLDNAERHTERSVAVAVRAEPGAVLVDVTDDGAGLGLAIARDVAARHGGTLTVGESAQGGALFRLRLPRST